MNLNRKSFTYQLYSWCYILSNKLFNKDSSDYEGGIYIPTNINLCPMMRTIFIWTPVYLAIFTTLVFGLGYILFYLPNTFGGIVGYMNTYLIPALVLGGIVGFFYLSSVIYDKYAGRHIETMEEMKARHEAGNYTFWEMLCNWYAARHEKFCPGITIVDSIEAVKEETKTVDETVVKDETVINKPSVEDIIEDIITDLNVNVETPASSTNTSADVKFLNKWSPNFNIFMATTAVIVVVAFLNWMMAFAMETEEVVFETAQCVASFDAEKQSGKIVCGDYTLDKNSVSFVSKTVILKKTPICKVTKGTLTDDITFDCGYSGP